MYKQLVRLATSLTAVAVLATGAIAPADASEERNPRSSPTERVEKSSPFRDAERLSTSTRAKDKSQKVQFAQDGSMTIAGSHSGTMTVVPVSDGPRNAKKSSTKDLVSAETRLSEGLTVVFAEKPDTAAAGFAVIESGSAAHLFSFDITVDGKPARLAVGSNGGVLVSDSTGEARNYIEVPWARNANGREVSTKFSVDGNRLTQTVSPSKATTYPIVADPQFGWLGFFPVVKFNRWETMTSTSWTGVLKVCAKLTSWMPVTYAMCGLSAGQIAIQAVIANANRECIQLAPAPIGAVAFRYSGGYCS